MALKRTLVQEEYLMISTGSDPATGYLSFYPKADGNFYKRTSAGVETKLWDSGNDGAGSGLDADLLDGLHSTEFFTVYQNYNKGEIYNFSGSYSPPAGSQPPVESNFIRQGAGHYFVGFTPLTGKVDILYNIYKRSLADSNIVIATQNVVGSIDGLFDGNQSNNAVTIDAPDPLNPSTFGIIEIGHTNVNNNLFLLFSRDVVCSLLKMEGWGSLGNTNASNNLKSWKFEIRSSLDGQWYTIIDRDNVIDYLDILSFHPFTKELFDAGHRYASAIRLTVRDIVPYTNTNFLRLGGFVLYTHYPNTDIADSVHALSQRGGTGYGNYKLYAGNNYSYNYVLDLYSYTGLSFLKVRNSDGFVGLGVTPTTQLHITGQFRSQLATGTAPFVIASTTVNTNLNADLLDGYHASAFALAGSGVTSFNTRTGAVTLTKADVEAVLTGVITSHTHNYTNNTGTVTSVAMTVPTGLAIAGSPITTSGTLALSFASGYSIPTTAKQTQWDTAYTHSQAAHQTIIDGTGFVKANGTTLSYDNSTYALSSHNHSGVYQPLDADLTAIAELSGTSGFLKKTAANTWSLDTTTYLTGTKVDSFNTRTGVVTLTKADVEGVLTGLITSHTHNYTNNTGTVTSVALSAPTGFSVAGTPVTSSGTLALSFASGYSLPTTAKQTEWDAAYYHSTLPHYQHWRVRVNSETGGLDVIDQTGVNFIAGTNVTISRSGGDITINSSGGGSTGVTSFNTRTGAVTLLKADVEGVLTGNITSHTHSYQPVISASDTQILFMNGTTVTGSPGFNYKPLTSDFSVGAWAEATGGNSYAIGASSATDQAAAIAIGYLAYSGGASSIAIGHSSEIYDSNSIAIGTGAIVESANGIAIGRGAYVNVTNDIAIGSASYNNSTRIYGAINFPTITQTGFLKIASGLISVDTNTYALDNHTHSHYVSKAGDTMTGNLLIHKTNSGSVNAQFGIKADATSNRYHEFRITSISDSDIYETALQMFTPTPTIYSMLIGSVSVDRGAQLSLGGANWDSLSIYAATDVIGNASYVYVSDTSDTVKKVPVASFGGGSGTVTSVGLSMPNIFSVSNSPVTTSGTLTATLVSQTKNHVLVAPQSANGVPTFRKLTADDMPDLSAMYDNYYCWNAQVNSGTTSQIISASQTPSTGQYKGIRFVEGTGITLSETNVSGILNLEIAADGSSGADNYEAWTLKYSVDGVPTSIPINSINSSGTYRAVRFGGSDIDILPQSESGNTMALLFKVKITPLEAVLTSNYGLTSANSDYNVLTVSNVPAGTYLAVVDSLGYHSTPSSTCTIIHRLRSSTGTNYLSTAVGNITRVNYRKGSMSGIITLAGTTTLYLTCRSTITGNSIYASCGYGNNATRVTLIKLA